ncbi:hypothetical protein M2302_002389 [Micromonospora sp. A200]|uniref:hypothetical protein n=1 Tax=Micromonospora sp. A200 TaxID=2940568 RepID=UPI00247391A7|nr:hypothetical protein [Micromonospora sp. A200]MDH6462211.1 hypothetical protein [Micromonospora sp. A200]
MRWRLVLLGLVTVVAGVAGMAVGLAGLLAGRPEMVGFVALGALALLLVVGLARDARRPRRRSRADDAAAGWYAAGPYGDAGADPGCDVPDPGPSDSGWSPSEPGPSDSGRGGGSGFWSGSGFWGGSDGGSGSHSGSDGGGSSWGGSDGGGGGSC